MVCTLCLWEEKRDPSSLRIFLIIYFCPFIVHITCSLLMLEPCVRDLHPRLVLFMETRRKADRWSGYFRLERMDILHCARSAGHSCHYHVINYSFLEIPARGHGGLGTKMQDIHPFQPWNTWYRSALSSRLHNKTIWDGRSRTHGSSISNEH